MSLTTTCRYQELAELAMRWLQSHADVAGSQAQDLKRQAPKEAARSPPLLDQMAHEVYRVVLFAVFYLQVSLLGYVPHVGVDLPLCARACSYSALCAAGHLVPEILDQVVSWVWDTIFTTDAIHPDSSLVDVQYLLDRATSVDAWASARGFGRSFYQMCASVHAGKVLYYFLVSWLYALYSFDYRWGLSHKHLQQRVAFFQQHWAFFLGGLPACLLPGAGSGSGLHFLSLKTMLCKALWHCALVMLSLCLRMDMIHSSSCHV